MLTIEWDMYLYLIFNGNYEFSFTGSGYVFNSSIDYSSATESDKEKQIRDAEMIKYDD